MKMSLKFLLGVSCAFSVVMGIQAEQSERPITVKLTGYVQGQDSLGNDKAIPFRYTTQNLLNEIGFFTGTNLTNGKLLLIDSITDTNLAPQIVARNASNQVDVTELFDIDQGDEVHSSIFVEDIFKSATLYSVDDFQFDTLDTDTNGLVLNMQLFAKESQRALLKTIGTNRFDVVAATLSFDGNGEIHDQYGLVAPIKGTVKIGAPKFVP